MNIKRKKQAFIKMLYICKYDKENYTCCGYTYP